MSYQYLDVKKEDRVSLCTINNPPMNLMNDSMVAELRQLAEEIESDSEVRVLVFTGGVEGIFVLHYDVGELSQMSDALDQAPTVPSDELHALNQTLNKLQSMTKPVIAALNGSAMGGAFELALGCDFRFMARVGMIGLPEINVGIMPGAGGTQRMTRLIGLAKALEMMLLGKVVEADEAESIGLIHKALDPGELLPYSMNFARALAERPPLSVALIKKCVYESIQLPLLDGLKLEQDCLLQTMASEDARRLMKDYLEGRLTPPENL